MQSQFWRNRHRLPPSAAGGRWTASSCLWYGNKPAIQGSPPPATDANQHTHTHPSTTPPRNAPQAREAREGTRVGPYHIPKGSTVVFNVFGVHRDPRHYPYPEEFRRVEVVRMGV